MERDARVGVVVITRDRAGEVLACVERLQATEASSIVVVDNGSNDASAARLRGAYRDVDVVALPRNEGAAARNIGVARCPQPYVAFCDDDSSWEPGALTRAADLLDSAPEVGLLCARVLLGDGREDPLCRELGAGLLGAGTLGPRILGFAACAAVVRRRAFLEAGGFHPALGVGGEEDLLAMDLAIREWGLEYAPHVVAHHTPSPRRDSAERRRRTARNRVLTAWMRRPVASALATSVCVITDGRRTREALLGVLAAAARMRAVRRSREVIPAHLEEQLRRLEAPAAH